MEYKNNESKYKEKYLIYKSKYLALKKQLGGAELEAQKEAIKNLMITNRFDKKKYTVHIKLLADKNDNKGKICHHYSLFSLYNISERGKCCGLDSTKFIDVLKPVTIGWTNDFSRSCSSPCSAIKYLPCVKECAPKTYPVRLYNFSGSEIDRTFFSHSSRFEGGRWWHKLNGYNCLVSIEEEPDLKIYRVDKEVQVTTYPVPSEEFEGGVETDNVVTIDLS